MGAVVYCRVSTEAQERDGTSLESQEEDCRRYVQEHGYELVSVERDVVTGATLDRPGLHRVREMVRAHQAQILVAYALDRLSRSQNHVGILDDECQRHGARLEFVTERFEDTPVGRFVRAARAFTDEIEREKIRERTTRGKVRRAREGRLVQGTGRGIYGYRFTPRGRGGDGTRNLEPVQAAVVRRIFADFTRGMSVHAIAARLNAEGVETLQGWEYGPDGRPLRRIPWYPLTVRRILQNETYTGRTVYRRTRRETVIDPATGAKKGRVVALPEDEWIEVPDATPPIIDRALWERVQCILTDPPHRARRGHAIYPYPLSGHIRCDACRTPLAGSALSGGTGRNRIRYYGCRNRNLPERAARCRSRYVRAETLEGRLIAALRRVLADPMQILTAYNALRANAATDDTRTIEAARQRLADAQAQLRRLAKLARFAQDDEVTEAVALSTTIRLGP